VLDRSGGRVVERDPPSRGSDDLGDPGAHLPGADYEDVPEAHDAEATGETRLRAAER